MKKNKFKKGFTLIEVVVSMAILSILIVFASSVFITAIYITGNNVSLKTANENAAAGVEYTMGGATPNNSISTTTQTTGSFSVTFGTTAITSNGKIIQSKDVTNNASFCYYMASS